MRIRIAIRHRIHHQHHVVPRIVKTPRRRLHSNTRRNARQKHLRHPRSRKSRPPMARLIPSVDESRLLGIFLLKIHAAHNADYSDTSEENHQPQGVSTSNLSGSKQQEADHQVEECPDHVHWSRGQSLSGWVSEWCGKSVARDAMHKMRHDIREKTSSKETSDIARPIHFDFPLR